MASGQPFASRSYAGTKLPERSVNTNAMPFSASSFSRHRGLGASAPNEFGVPEGPKPQQQQQQAMAQTAPTQSHGPVQDTNPLNRLTEEQREEINEAVRNLPRGLCLIKEAREYGCRKKSKAKQILFAAAQNRETRTRPG